jgi:saccharopine dehydrogenase-like NADP-dependent oxidoreductase
MKICVLGAGLVGGPMALDLAKDNEFEVYLYDINENRLENFKTKGIITEKADLSNKDILKEKIQHADIVLNALPGFLGFSTFKTVIECGKNIVDISFFAEDPFEIEELALKNNVIAIMDCGVAPGMSNILAAYGTTLLDKTDNILIYVGGLPKVRICPYEYKAVFSPIDVIEEYTRPARYIENGNLIVKPALSDPELINFPEVGTLEAFNSDGIRTLAKTLKADNIKEKTLRYPGHIEKIILLRETGFFSKDTILINETPVRPIDFTAKLLFKKWKFEENDEDITIMRVIVEGTKNNEKIRYTWDLYDTYCKTTSIHSMARTTGYTATMVIRLIKDKIFTKKGLFPPEYIGFNEKCVKYLLKGLADRNVIYKETVTKI